MEEQLDVVHKVVDVVDQPNRKVCVTILRYHVDKLECSFPQLLVISRKKEEEKFQQNVDVRCTLE